MPPFALDDDVDDIPDEDEDFDEDDEDSDESDEEDDAEEDVETWQVAAAGPRHRRPAIPLKVRLRLTFQQ